MKWRFLLQGEDRGRMQARVIQIIDRLVITMGSLSFATLDGQVFLSFEVEYDPEQARHAKLFHSLDPAIVFTPYDPAERFKGMEYIDQHLLGSPRDGPTQLRQYARPLKKLSQYRETPLTVRQEPQHIRMV